jgi:putative ABC transport system permease protein
MDNLLQDLRLALRNLRRMPQFTLPVLIVLALGLGATAAMVGTLRTVFFTDPPYANSQQIHALWWEDQRGWSMPSSWPMYQELQSRLEGVSAVEGINSINMNLTGDKDPEIVRAGQVTAGFFNVFQVQPLLGSLHWAPDTTRGVVLTENLWSSRYNRDPNILGRTIQLNGVEHPILGVVPKTMQLRRNQLFLPFVPGPNHLNHRYNRFMNLFIRLAPGTGAAQIRAELAKLTKAMAEEHPGAPEATVHMVSQSWISMQRESYRTMGAILALATVFLVALTLVNLANAMLARALAAAEETALRMALGASSWMAIRPRLMESFLLSLGGAALGLGVAQATLALLTPVVSAELQAVRPLALDATLLGWTTFAALIVALGMAGIPGLLMSRVRLSSLLNDGSRSVAKGGSRHLRVTLVVVQVALALTLLASFTSLEGTLLRLMRTPLGLRSKGVAVFTCDTSTKDAEANKQADLKAMALMERLRAVPGANRVGSIAMLPVEEYGWNFSTETHDRPSREDEWVEMRTASPGLFDAFGIKLLAGRNYTEADMKVSEAPIAIISQSMARTFFPGKDPIGQEFKYSGQWIQVVGVVSDVRNAGPGTEAHQATAYFASPTGMATTTFVVQFDNPRLMNLEAIRSAAREAAPDWPIKGLRRMDDVIATSMEGTATQTHLMGLAGGLALLLALAGLHSLLAYLVAQRTREFGIRGALGATAGDIFRLVLKRGLWTSSLGIGAGLAGAIAAGRLLAAFLADARPSSPTSLLGAASILLLGSIIASLLPALRAASIQPAEALRQN